MKKRNWIFSGKKCPSCKSEMILNKTGHECGAAHCEYTESIFNKISDNQFNRMCREHGWQEIPTYKDYYEPPTQEEVIAALEHFADNQQDYPEEFKKTFKKRFKDILA